MKRLIFAFCALALVASAAFADVPDPSKCQTTRDAVACGYIVPDQAPLGTPNPAAAASFTVTVRNGSNLPINNAVVEVIVGGIADSKTRLCADTQATKNTNASGVVTFNIGGGGCYKGANAFVIRANGDEIRNFNAVMSSDYTGTDNSGIANRWNLAVTAADFAAFGQAFQGGTGPASCHDYDNSGGMGAADFAIFGGIWAGGVRACN